MTRTFTGEQIIISPDTDPDWDGSGFWEDLRFPFTGARLESAATRYSYNTALCGVQFDSDARYPNEIICMVAQLPHAWVRESPLRPHIHYHETSGNLIPNWLMEWAWAPNEGPLSAWTLAAWNGAFFSYSAPNIGQIASFPEIAGTGYDLSDMLLVKFYRDSTNASGLFAGADPLAADRVVWEFDIHVLIENLGSPNEYFKLP